jgi:hypothetical protein
MAEEASGMRFSRQACLRGKLDAGGGDVLADTLSASLSFKFVIPAQAGIHTDVQSPNGFPPARE